MYKFEEINTRYDFDCPIEAKIVDFLNYYKIPKENIINIRNIGGNLATIIFETDGSKFEETEYRRFDI